MGFLTLLANAFKAIATALGMVRDKQLRNDGATAQVAKDQEDELANIRNADAAAGDPAALDRVRNLYAIKRPE